MEFSFDRGAKPQKPTTTNSTEASADPYSEARSQHLKSQGQGNSQVQSSFINQSMSPSSSSTSAEDRLKKAIERNRAKQEVRTQQEVKVDSSNRPAPQSSGWAPGQVFNKPELKTQPQASHSEGPQRVQPQSGAQANAWTPGQVFNKPDARAEQVQAQVQLQAQRQSPMQSTPPKSPEIVRPEVLNREAQKPLSERLAEAQKENFNRSSSGNVAGAGARINSRTSDNTRESNPTDILEKKIPTSRAVVSKERRITVEEEFTTPVKKVPKKITTPAYAAKKSNSLDPKWQNYLIKGCWFFCALMLLRLFFSQGGIIDYHGQSNVLNEKKLELEQIKSENMAFTKEISRMMNDTGYQKKIVRDNLGFIAQDEFLILFPKE